MNWTPIDLKQHTANSARLSWSESAIRCYSSNRDCFNCENAKIIDKAWDTGCKMPVTVQKLLNKGIVPIPKRATHPHQKQSLW